MRDYYGSKPDDKVPKSVKAKKKKSSKKKKGTGKKKSSKKKVTKKPVITEPSYINDAGTSTVDSYAATVSTMDSMGLPSGAPRTHETQVSVSVDYMDEEKDLDYEAYQNKTEEQDNAKSERERKERIEQMKAMERQDRQQREMEKVAQQQQAQKEKEEREKVCICVLYTHILT